MLRTFGKCHLDGDMLKFLAGLNVYRSDTRIFGCRATLHWKCGHQNDGIHNIIVKDVTHGLCTTQSPGSLVEYSSQLAQHSSQGLKRDLVPMGGGCKLESGLEVSPHPDLSHFKYQRACSLSLAPSGEIMTCL